MNQDVKSIVLKTVGGMLLAFLLLSGGAWAERLAGNKDVKALRSDISDVERALEDMTVRLRQVEARMDVADERWTFVSDQLARIQGSLDRAESKQ